jgi:hypothetical protein
MSDRERLHEIIDTLAPQQVHALLTLLESARPVSDEEFVRRLAEAPEEEADEETVARILAAEAEQGEMVSHSELKQRLGLLPRASWMRTHRGWKRRKRAARPPYMSSRESSRTCRKASATACWTSALRANGHFAVGEALQPPNSAKTVCLKNGKVMVIDGPYAETKEQIGGILVLEARDLHYAVQLVSQHRGLGRRERRGTFAEYLRK